MTRIRIEVPSTYQFQTLIAVRITDVNYGGHVGNDSFLSILHEARVQFFRNFGYSELKLEGVSLIMSNVAIEFKSELFYGDQVKAFVRASGFSKVGFELFYKLETTEGKIAAIAKTGMVCYDYSLKKIVALPEAAINKLSS